jgi:hypothetical protein
MPPRLSLASLVLLVVAAGPSTGQDDVGIDRSFYANIYSVHMRADLVIERGGVKTIGSYEYWADGDKYRINCATGGAPGLMGDVQYAYDGSQFQFLNSEADALSYQTGDVERLPTAVPNPFFLPVDYLNPDQDSCPGCVLRLRHLRGEPRAFQSKIDASDLTLRTRPGAIEWLRRDGTTFSTIGLAIERRGFPHRIVLTDFDERATKIAEVQAVIRELAINEEVDPAVFRLPTDAASSVWNLDIPDLRAARVR